MFKWHVHSAIGRSRPVAAADISRVVDGIAASLRQFSVSVARSADEGPTKRRSAGDTFKEVSSLGPAPSRGIDARSLAAKAPTTQGFKITRVAMGSSDGGRGRGSRSPNYRGSDRAGGPPRGIRGPRQDGVRVGAGARGRPAARGGARGRAGPKDRAKKMPAEDDYVEEPYNEEEIEYMYAEESGHRKPYDPTTSLETLRGYGAAGSITNPRGIKENIINRFATGVGAEFRASVYNHGRDHILNVARNGSTIFESTEQRKIAEHWQRTNPDEATEYVKSMGVQPSGRMGKLSEEQKNMILDAWVAGKHAAPKEEKKGDVLSTVEMMTQRNETYLPEDSKRFEEKLKSLLPKQTATPSQPARKLRPTL